MSEILKNKQLVHSLTPKEKASLAGALRYMMEYPDVYVSQYEFYGEDTYLHKKMDIIVTLKKKYDQEAANILSSTDIHYSNEELLVIWTIINIMIQVIGDDESKKEHADVFKSLMQKFAPFAAKAENGVS
jgi:hypothetical protein